MRSFIEKKDLFLLYRFTNCDINSILSMLSKYEHLQILVDRDLFCLPLLGKHYSKLKKKLNVFLENITNANFSLWMNHSISTIGNLFRNKDKQVYYISLGQCMNFNACLEKPILNKIIEIKK